MRPPLSFVDRAGIAVAELVELAGRVILAGDEGDDPLRRAGLGVERDSDPVALDRADRADIAVDKPGLSIGPMPGACR